MDTKGLNWSQACHRHFKPETEDPKHECPGCGGDLRQRIKPIDDLTLRNWIHFSKSNGGLPLIEASYEIRRLRALLDRARPWIASLDAAPEEEDARDFIMMYIDEHKKINTLYGNLLEEFHGRKLAE